MLSGSGNAQGGPANGNSSMSMANGMSGSGSAALLGGPQGDPNSPMNKALAANKKALMTGVADVHQYPSSGNWLRRPTFCDVVSQVASLHKEGNLPSQQKTNGAGSSPGSGGDGGSPAGSAAGGRRKSERRKTLLGAAQVLSGNPLANANEAGAGSPNKIQSPNRKRDLISRKKSTTFALNIEEAVSVEDIDKASAAPSSPGQGLSHTGKGASNAKGLTGILTNTPTSAPTDGSRTF